MEEFIKKLAWKFIWDNCKEKDDEIFRILKVKKATERLCGGLYFIFSTIYGYHMLLKTDFLP